MARLLPRSGESWRRDFRSYQEEALRNINAVVRVIAQEFIQEAKPLPEGADDAVEVQVVSQEQFRIAVTV
jgi:hypothetical protein